MSIKILKGDLLAAPAQLICHGVNSRGKFASGIAGQIRKKWPSVYDDYTHKYKVEGWKLGDVQFCKINHPHIKYIVNCCTQKDFGYDNKLYADYTAIKDCMDAICKFANREKYIVALPKIGCGLANGCWSTVYTILHKLSQLYPDVKLEVYEL